jgi:hypothetical protein
MKTNKYIMTLGIGIFAYAAVGADKTAQQIPNRLIDYPGFVRDAAKVGEVRQTRRVTEEEFIRLAAERASVVLDARSDDKYQLLHVKGARHLSLPNFTEAELQKVIPNKGTRVLIYCNNNFENEPVAFASKVAKASLNIYTFNSLYSYGYTNVYELGPLLDIKKTKLQLAGTSAKELCSQENEGSAQK